jgi:mono/diheme cytochrome c family protein
MTLVRKIHIYSVACFFALTVAAQVVPSFISPDKPNPLVWDALEKSDDLPAMTNTAHFTFWVTNTSAAKATILSTETECDCTVAETGKKLPWTIAPGEGGMLNVSLNSLGKFGLVTKTVTVTTSHGTQNLTIRVNIPLTPAPFNISARQRDVMAAKADRQAVFRDHCAACHAWPAAGQTGEALFDKACGICHTADHRAEMVPELAFLNRETSAGYWRTNVIFGKPGSLMPAFAKSEGGILETNQIESLVEYLVKRYPSKRAASSAHGAVSAPVNHDPAGAPPSPAAK